MLLSGRQFQEVACFPHLSSIPEGALDVSSRLFFLFGRFLSWEAGPDTGRQTRLGLGGAGNWAPCPKDSGNALWDTCSQNPPVYPDGNFNAVIQGGPVTLATGNGISINFSLGSGDTLIITPGYLDITGTSIANNGSINIGAGNGLTLEGSTTVTLSGSGTLTLTDATARFGGGNGSPSLVIQQTIQGQGSIGRGGMAITNQSTINANAGLLTVQPLATPGITNTGTMEASSGGTLEIVYGVPGPFNNTGGTVQALSGGTVVGFVLVIGDSFTILTGSAVSGQFATVKGLSINSSEHFQVNYSSTAVALTVVSGP
jgi:hypothetical protein